MVPGLVRFLGLVRFVAPRPVPPTGDGSATRYRL